MTSRYPLAGIHTEIRIKFLIDKIILILIFYQKVNIQRIILKRFNLSTSLSLSLIHQVSGENGGVSGE